MIRSSVVLALVALAACGPPPAVPPPDDLSLALREAFEAEDAERAQVLLERAAASGDLNALHHLARAYEKGQHSARSFRGTGALHLPVRAMPWEGYLARRHFERALRDSAAAGSHRALFLIAQRLIFPRAFGEDGETDADSGRAIYHRLRDEAARPFHLAVLAQQLSDRDAYEAHLLDGARAGDPEACTFHVMSSPYDGAPNTAVRLSSTLDRLAVCEALSGGETGVAWLHGYGDRVIGSLSTEAEAGNLAAVATLDSLRAMGVFDRHPRLGALGKAEA